MPSSKSTPSYGDHTYKLIEIVGTSTKGYDDAVRHAVAEAAKTLEGLAWFEVVEQRGMIHDGKVVEFQVTVKIGFRLKSNR